MYVLCRTPRPAPRWNPFFQGGNDFVGDLLVKIGFLSRRGLTAANGFVHKDATYKKGRILPGAEECATGSGKKSEIVSNTT